MYDRLTKIEVIMKSLKICTCNYMYNISVVCDSNIGLPLSIINNFYYDNVSTL